jgi:hypothetical protein
MSKPAAKTKSKVEADYVSDEFDSDDDDAVSLTYGDRDDSEEDAEDETMSDSEGRFTFAHMA